MISYSLFSAGFNDPLSAYTNTRAFLDYRVMGFRECVAEVARYMTNVEGLDMKDPMRVRLLNHLENYLAQRELAINAAVAASAQMGMPKFSPALPTGIAIQPTTGPFIPIPSHRTSPDRLSPTFTAEGIPLSVALPTPVISFATTATVPVFGPAASIGTHPSANISLATAKIEQQPPTSPPVKKFQTTSANGKQQPFRPWADSTQNDD